MKKIISLTIALIMFISIFSAQYVYADTSDSTILARIEDLCDKLENTYFTKDRSTGCGKKSSGHDCANCLTSNIVQATWFKNMFGDASTSSFANSYGKDVSYTRAGYSCAGFANFAEWYIFKSSNSDVISTSKIGTYDFNYNNISKYAKIGDILRLNNSHSVIYINASSNGINVLDSNFNGTYNCMVDRHNISYDSYSYFTISRATNRQISPEEPETTSPPTNVSIAASSNFISTGQSVTFNFSQSGATYWYIDIERNDSREHLELVTGKSTYTYTFQNEGKYKVWMKAANSSGWTNKYVTITVSNSRPYNVSITPDTTYISTNKPLNFDFTLDNAAYWYFIVAKDGVRETVVLITGKYEYSYTFKEEGVYTVEIQTANINGWTNKGVEITVSNQPQKPSLNGMKKYYSGVETVAFNWNETGATTHYNLYIRKMDSNGEYQLRVSII